MVYCTSHILVVRISKIINATVALKLSSWANSKCTASLFSLTTDLLQHCHDEKLDQYQDGVHTLAACDADASQPFYDGGARTSSKWLCNLLTFIARCPRAAPTLAEPFPEESH